MHYLSFAVVFLVQDGQPETKAPPSPVRLLVPAYFYPAGQGLKDWDSLLASPARKSLVVIVNPASGPGEKADPNYEKIIERAKKAELTLIGYVTTSYAKKPLGDVKNDVDRWLRLYPGIKGIFLDEQASGADKVDHYADLYRHVRKTHRLGLVISNPGTVCAEEYLTRPACDAACIFEGKGQNKTALPAWADRHAGRVAILAYNVETAALMRQQLRHVMDRKFGFVYITDRAGANPWDGLPRYWDEEVAAVLKAKGKER